MNKKGQAAMEFLMTYGWAILVVLAAIAALAYFGVLSPSKMLPERTTFSAPLPHVANAVIDMNGSVTVAFRNNEGVTVAIDGNAAGFATSDSCGATPNIVVIYDGTAYDTASVNIINGDGFLVTWDCTAGPKLGDKFEADVLGFSYTNVETQLPRKHSGSVQGKYQ